jgi:hypothetical protein
MPDVKGGPAAEGFASGKRSAIIETASGKYLRLKGCGNLSEGFPV